MRLVAAPKIFFIYYVAIKYLEQSAALGEVEAMIELGDIFYGAGSAEDLHNPEEIIQSDNSRALKFYSQAAEKIMLSCLTDWL